MSEVDSLPISDAFPAVIPPEEVELTEEEKAAAEQKQLSERALQHRAEMFIEMSKTDAFQALMRELESKKTRMHAQFAAGLLAGDEVNQRQVDYDRGFIAGLAYIEQMLEGAANVLKRLDREAAAEQSEPEDDTEGDLWK